jgi:hypothetical protein
MRMFEQPVAFTGGGAALHPSQCATQLPRGFRGFSGLKWITTWHVPKWDSAGLNIIQSFIKFVYPIALTQNNLNHYPSL